MQYPSVWKVRDRFKNAFELLNQIALKFVLLKIHIFHYLGKVSCVEFQSVTLNPTQNILPLHLKICFYTRLECLGLLDIRVYTLFEKHLTPTPVLEQITSYEPDFKMKIPAEISAY